LLNRCGKDSEDWKFPASPKSQLYVYGGVPPVAVLVKQTVVEVAVDPPHAKVKLGDRRLIKVRSLKHLDGE
jgi:hypothetical protein